MKILEQLSNNEYRVTLIISQYYHSYHYFIVMIPNDVNYIRTLREFTEELDSYKGSTRCLKDSDVFYYKETNKIKHRYNVNSNGDIYFLNFCTSNAAQQYIQKSIHETRYFRRGYKKKSVLEYISKHHDYDKVREIVEKHFVIA